MRWRGAAQARRGEPRFRPPGSFLGGCGAAMLLLAACGSAAAPSAPPSSTAPSQKQASEVKLTMIDSEAVGQDTVETVAFSPDGMYLAVGAADGMIGVIPLQPADPTDIPRAVKLHAGFDSALAWSPNGKEAASAASDGAVRVWDGKTLQLIHSYTAVPNTHPAIAWSPDGRRLAVAQGRDSILVVDPAQPAAQPVALSLPGVTRALLWLPAGNEIVGSDDAGDVLFFRPDAPQAIRTYKPATPHKAVNSLSVSPADGLLAVGYDDGAVVLVDPATATEKARLPAGRSVGTLAWSPNGELLAETSIAFDVTLWDRAGHKVAHLDIGSDMNGLAWSADGRFLAAGSDDHTFKLWEVSPPQTPARTGPTPPSFMGR